MGQIQIPDPSGVDTTAPGAVPARIPAPQPPAVAAAHPGAGTFARTNPEGSATRETQISVRSCSSRSPGISRTVGAGQAGSRSMRMVNGAEGHCSPDRRVPPIWQGPRTGGPGRRRRREGGRPFRCAMGVRSSPASEGSLADCGRSRPVYRAPLLARMVVRQPVSRRECIAGHRCDGRWFSRSAKRCGAKPRSRDCHNRLLGRSIVVTVGTCGLAHACSSTPSFAPTCLCVPYAARSDVGALGGTRPPAF